MSLPREPSACTILVVEDDFLIAMDLVAALEDEGFTVRGPASTVWQALRMLEKSLPDAAILDLSLGDEPSTPVARALQDHGVPFLLLSARTAQEMPADEVIQAAPKLTKPVSDVSIVHAVRTLLGRAG